MSQTCEGCQHFHKASGPLISARVQGECRRYPPTQFLIPIVSQIAGQAQIQFSTRYPSVPGDFGSCGEFASRPGTIFEPSKPEVDY